MKDAISLAPEFEKATGINLKFVSLPENQARAKITASTATEGGEFDVVMISNYEAPQWAANGWLENLEPHMKATPTYDESDFIPSIKQSLSYQDQMYAVPFYGESSFLAYRKDLFEKAGITMPAKPTWQQIAEYAAKLDDKANGVAGICLRGKPGWGESLAPFTTVANTFGGSWFDKDWNAKLTSPEFKEAVELLRQPDPRRTVRSAPPAPGSPSAARATRQGNAAMWYDATVMAGTNRGPVEQQDRRQVRLRAGAGGQDAGQRLALHLGARHPEGRQGQGRGLEVHGLDDRQGVRAEGRPDLRLEPRPAGRRVSPLTTSPTTPRPRRPTRSRRWTAIADANQQKAMANPVPYPGIQFVGIPEFQDLGTRVSQQLSAAIAGRESVDDALKQSQEYAQTVGDSYKAVQ